MFAVARGMLSIRRYAVILLITILTLGTARAAQAQRIITGPFGAVAGILSGGYITLSIVVTRAQFGHYLHGVDDVFGWQSMPVLIGGTTGAALGVWDPDRLMTGFVYGSVGTLAGGSIGFVTGYLISKRPEGKWAGGAIGAGIGMAIGSTLGVFFPNEKMNPFNEDRSNTAVPLTIRLPL